MKKIILTGGGTAGHVTPNIALIPRLRAAGFSMLYIGSYEGIERRLIEQAGIPYRGISSGKLRRYFDLKNFTDPFRVLKGYAEATAIIKEFQPDLVFSKGGYVAVPVVKAAQAKRIPVIIHESDMTPGLANRLSYGAASKICCNFTETMKYIPARKAVLTGSPIRSELLSGSRERGLELTGFSPEKPVLLVIGGSLGSRAINAAVRSALPRLLPNFQLLHLCGRDNIDKSLKEQSGYLQFEYVSDELKDYFALADLLVSRAGANAICEILALKKPNILIPLSARASRGDQILNARSYEKEGYSFVLEEEKLNEFSLLAAVRSVWEKRGQYIEAMSQSPSANGAEKIAELIIATAGAGNE